MYQECVLKSYDTLLNDHKVTIPSEVSKEFRAYLHSENVPFIQVKSGWQIDCFGRHYRMHGNTTQFVLSEWPEVLP